MEFCSYSDAFLAKVSLKKMHLCLDVISILSLSHTKFKYDLNLAASAAIKSHMICLAPCMLSPNIGSLPLNWGILY
jgi:hypothetical protein